MEDAFSEEDHDIYGVDIEPPQAEFSNSTFFANINRIAQEMACELVLER